MRLRWKRPLLIGIIVISTTVGCGLQPAQRSPSAVAPGSTVYVEPTPLGAVPRDLATRLPIPTLVLPTPITQKPLAEGTWPQAWLQHPVCQPPCWEGITPGQTRIHKAIDLLNRSQLVRTIRRSTSDSRDTYDLAIWEGGSNGMYGNIAYPLQPGDPLVTGITVFFPTTVELQQVIDVYGEPSHLLPLETIASDPHSGQTAHVYELVVVYMSKGFYLTLSVERIGKPVIAPELALFGKIRFFTPTAAGLDAFASDYQEQWTSADLIPWQGFQEFDQYCAQMRPVPYNICGGGYQRAPT